MSGRNRATARRASGSAFRPDRRPQRLGSLDEARRADLAVEGERPLELALAGRSVAGGEVAFGREQSSVRLVRSCPHRREQIGGPIGIPILDGSCRQPDRRVVAARPRGGLLRQAGSVGRPPGHEVARGLDDDRRGHPIQFGHQLARGFHVAHCRLDQDPADDRGHDRLRVLCPARHRKGELAIDGRPDEVATRQQDLRASEPRTDLLVVGLDLAFGDEPISGAHPFIPSPDIDQARDQASPGEPRIGRRPQPFIDLDRFLEKFHRPVEIALLEGPHREIVESPSQFDRVRRPGDLDALREICITTRVTQDLLGDRDVVECVCPDLVEVEGIRHGNRLPADRDRLLAAASEREIARRHAEHPGPRR